MKLRPHKMKLSEKTVNLLKNFASINQSILFKRGDSLRTMSVMKNILAEADISEEIPQDFAIYDLVQFLNGVSLYGCLLYTSPSPRDRTRSRMPSSA